MQQPVLERTLHLRYRKHKPLMLADTPLTVNAGTSLGSYFRPILTGLRNVAIWAWEKSLAYKFQDAREMSLALFIFIEVGLGLRGGLYCSVNGKLSSNTTANRRPLSGYHGYFQKSVPASARRRVLLQLSIVEMIVPAMTRPSQSPT
jgi:hypothetical protein